MHFLAKTFLPIKIELAFLSVKQMPKLSMIEITNLDEKLLADFVSVVEQVRVVAFDQNDQNGRFFRSFQKFFNFSRVNDRKKTN